VRREAAKGPVDDGPSSLLLGGAGLISSGALARAQHAGHPALPAAPSSTEPFAKLQGGVPHHMTPDQEAQRVYDSPAPKGPPGRWQARAALSLPRSEMAWATAWADRMHIVGGYGGVYANLVDEI
jgi:hypothetical protein